jgi:hypothetical protein
MTAAWQAIDDYRPVFKESIAARIAQPENTRCFADVKGAILVKSYAARVAQAIGNDLDGIGYTISIPIWQAHDTPGTPFGDI